MLHVRFEARLGYTKSFYERFLETRLLDARNLISKINMAHRTGPKLRNTFSLISLDHGSQEAFETMIDVIETFRNTTEAVNQKLVLKRQYETNTCHKVE